MFCNKQMFYLLFMLTLPSHAVDIVNCSPEEQALLNALHSADKLSSQSLVAADKADHLIKNLHQCEIKEDVMMDGLRFTLYQGIENGTLFVRIHNDLDGSSKLYGPLNQ